MVNHLCWAGVDGSQEILDEMYGDPAPTDDLTGEVNVPGPVRGFNEIPLLSGRPFELASAELGHDEIFNLIQAWIVEDKASFLPKVLNNPKSTLSDVSRTIRRSVGVARNRRSRSVGKLICVPRPARHGPASSRRITGRTARPSA